MIMPLPAVWKSGETQFIRIKSLAGETWRLRCDLKGEIKLTGSKTTTFTLHEGLIELNLKKGEEVVLYTGEKPKSFVVSSLPMDPDQMNSWGEGELRNERIRQ